tara:strand:- start:173 stop:937 length:765 start_codon:yes stop_codon:yes gene_type:complete
MLPLFKSHFSIGRSILTLSHPDKCVEDGPDSIFKLAVDNNFKQLVLVEDSFNGFLEAKKNCEQLDLHLVFGLRFTIAENIDEKLSKDNNNKHKIIIFAKNDNGIKTLYKIHNKAFARGLGHLDYDYLKSNWNDDLKLIVPFYDSFIATNLTSFSNCIPDFSFCNPIFFVENNGLLLDEVILPSVQKYCNDNNYQTEKVKSIYYNKKSDVKAFQTYKCLCSRSFGRQKTLDEPNLEHFGSDEFCFESWQEKNENR